MPSISTTIYIVEDEAIIAMELADQLELLGYEVLGTAAWGEKALAAMEVQLPDIVLMDINLSGEINGIETARRLRNRHNIPVVFLTAFSDASLVNQARKTSPFGYLVKPFEACDLSAALQLALSEHRVVERYRRSVSSESKLGTGSTFNFTLPPSSSNHNSPAFDPCGS